MPDDATFEGGCFAYPENMTQGELLDLVSKGLENPPRNKIHVQCVYYIS